jgi:hypothetical protein
MAEVGIAEVNHARQPQHIRVDEAVVRAGSGFECKAPRHTRITMRSLVRAGDWIHPRRRWRPGPRDLRSPAGWRGWWIADQAALALTTELARPHQHVGSNRARCHVAVDYGSAWIARREVLYQELVYAETVKDPLKSFILHRSAKRRDSHR